MATVFKPPTALNLPNGTRSVFLAGSIELGAAGPWQTAVETALAAHDVALLNPRRDAWDASWVQDISNPQFREQVEWELDALERATHIAMHFEPATRSPITLLELGLFARSGRMIVSCPEGFWRRGNIQVVCARYGVPLVSSLDALIARLLTVL